MSLFDFYVDVVRALDDIFVLLQFDFAGLSDVHVDLDYVARRAHSLGDDVLAL